MRQKLDLLSEAAEELTTILQVCCEAYDVDINEVKSRSRKEWIVTGKHPSNIH